MVLRSALVARLVTVLLSLHVPGGASENVTWVGEAGASMLAPSSWNPARVPTPGDTAVVWGADVVATLPGAGTLSLGSLVVSTGASISVVCLM
jgi:hypothetical protein